jgi:hypothetical protein
MSGLNRKLTTGAETPESVMAAQKGILMGGDGYAFPQDISPEFCFGIMTKRFKHDQSGNRSSVVGSHYVLPLPASIQDTQGIQYNTPAPGAVTAGLASLGTGFLGSMMDKSASEAGTVFGVALKSLADQVTAGAQTMGAKDGISALQLGAQFVGAGDNYFAGTAGAFMGEVPNPNITAFFQGVSLRNHSFQWDMYPQSSDESTTLHNMIRSLRRDALPARKPMKFSIADAVTADSTGSSNRVIPGGAVSVSPFLTYPLEAHITITTMGQQNTIRFKPAFIESISVNYSPGGVAFLQNGMPAGVQLAMSFKEVDIHTREDYEGHQFGHMTEDAANLHLVE